MNNFYITLLFHVIKSAVVVVGIFKRIKGDFYKSPIAVAVAPMTSFEPHHMA